jgi:anti-sigma B factor antagonist
MRITERVVGSVTVLDLSGKLALDDGNGLLKDKVHSLLNQGRMQIALNLAEVTYVDSAGLGELVAAQGTVTKNGGQIKVFNLTKRVSDLLTITKVLTVFDTYNSEAEALAAFQPSAT